MDFRAFVYRIGGADVADSESAVGGPFGAQFGVDEICRLNVEIASAGNRRAVGDIDRGLFGGVSEDVREMDAVIPDESAFDGVAVE